MCFWQSNDNSNSTFGSCKCYATCALYTVSSVLVGCTYAFVQLPYSSSLHNLCVCSVCILSVWQQFMMCHGEIHKCLSLTGVPLASNFLTSPLIVAKSIAQHLLLHPQSASIAVLTFCIINKPNALALLAT